MSEVKKEPEPRADGVQHEKVEWDTSSRRFWKPVVFEQLDAEPFLDIWSDPDDPDD